MQVKEDEQEEMMQKLKEDAVTEDKKKETSLDRNAMKTRRPSWLRTLLCLGRQTAPRRRRRGVRRQEGRGERGGRRGKGGEGEEEEEEERQVCRLS